MWPWCGYAPRARLSRFVHIARTPCVASEQATRPTHPLSGLGAITIVARRCPAARCCDCGTAWEAAGNRASRVQQFLNTCVPLSCADSERIRYRVDPTPHMPNQYTLPDWLTTIRWAGGRVNVASKTLTIPITRKWESPLLANNTYPLRAIGNGMVIPAKRIAAG